MIDDDSQRRVKARIVGVGPGSKEYLTSASVAAVNASDVVMGWDLDLSPVKDLIANKRVFLQDASNFQTVAGEAARYCLSETKHIAILRVGDPCISSGLSGLLSVFEGFDIEVIPGISSIQSAAAICKLNIDDSVIVSFHEYGDPETKKAFMIHSIRKGRHIIMIPSPDMRPEDAARFLIENGVAESSPGTVLSRITLPEESRFSGTLRDISTRGFDWLSVAVFQNPNAPGAQEAKAAWERWRSNHKILS